MCSEVALDEIADIDDLPPAYAWPGYAHMGPVTRYLMAADSISTLFPQLRAKYQEARIPAATEGRIPVVLSLEGSVCPFDPNRPVPKPLPEYPVTAEDEESCKGEVTIGEVPIKIDKVAVRLLATLGTGVVKANGRTVVLRLQGHNSAGSASTADNGVAPNFRSLASRFDSPQDPNSVIPYFPESVTDDEEYDQIVLALVADPRCSAHRFFNTTANEPWASAVAALSDGQFWVRWNHYQRDPRYTEFKAKHLQVPNDADFIAPVLEPVHSRPKLPRYDIGLFTTFEQTWTLAGYSRGSLVNSITLAPQEEITIEIFTFDRRKVEEERTLTTEFERNTDVSAMNTITSTIAREFAENSHLAGDLGLGLPIPAGEIPVNLDASGDASLDVARPTSRPRWSSSMR